MHVYPIRFARAWARHWLAILIGSATGLYIAVGFSFGLMLADLSYGWDLNEDALAFALNVILLVGMVGGGFLGYVRRRR